MKSGKHKSLAVGILMGSDSDWPIMKEAADALRRIRDRNGSQRHLGTPRAPRPESLRCQRSYPECGSPYRRSGRCRAFAGVTAALTPLPVIGVPVAGKFIKGWDALLSIVQMPSGVPVATVAIGGARNAGLLAVQILAVGNSALQKKFLEFKSPVAGREPGEEPQPGGLKQHVASWMPASQWHLRGRHLRRTTQHGRIASYIRARARSSFWSTRSFPRISIR